MKKTLLSVTVLLALSGCKTLEMVSCNETEVFNSQRSMQVAIEKLERVNMYTSLEEIESTYQNALAESEKIKNFVSPENCISSVTRGNVMHTRNNDLESLTESYEVAKRFYERIKAEREEQERLAALEKLQNEQGQHIVAMINKEKPSKAKGYKMNNYRSDIFYTKNYGEYSIDTHNGAFYAKTITGDYAKKNFFSFSSSINKLGSFSSLTYFDGPFRIISSCEVPNEFEFNFPMSSGAYYDDRVSNIKSARIAINGNVHELNSSYYKKRTNIGLEVDQFSTIEIGQGSDKHIRISRIPARLINQAGKKIVLNHPVSDLDTIEIEYTTLDGIKERTHKHKIDLTKGNKILKANNLCKNII